MSILDFWPFPNKEIRPIQRKALLWIEQELKNPDIKYLILEAPVGSGKSMIALTTARYINRGLGNSFILTPQRILQAQYMEEFPHNWVNTLYGKSNYSCMNLNSTCEIGSAISSCDDSCRFRIAKQNAKRSPNVVLNYSLALASFSYTNTFNPRELMICDEAHNLESFLCEFDKTNVITQSMAKKINVPFKFHTDIDSAIDYLKNIVMPNLETYLDDLEYEVKEIKTLKRSEITKEHISKVAEYNRVCTYFNAVDGLISVSLEYIHQNYVLIHDKKTEYSQFKRLFGKYTFKNTLDNMADKFLMMSGTIFDKNAYCSDLGIDPAQTSFISLDSTFPIENRPVVVNPVMKMNFSWKEDINSKNRKAMIQAIVKILEHHKDDSGIIHTGSFQIADWIIDELGFSSHLIFSHGPASGEDRNKIIEAFMKSKKPSVLISPSITEGLDLKDDLSRFAIFAKVPFPYIGDQWIKRRMELSSNWYARKTLIDILQGCGRVVRSPTDVGVSYILDGSFQYLYNTNSYMIPKWWKQSIKYEK